MAEIGIERLRAGDGQEDSTDRHEGHIRRIDEESHDVMRAYRPQDFRIGDDVLQPGKADGEKPDGGDRAEHEADAAGAEALDCKQHRKDQQGQRHHIGLEGRRDDIHAFDRREHRDGGRDDRVAEEQRCPHDAYAEHNRRTCREGAARQRHQRQDAALAAVVGAQHEHDVLDRDRYRQRPDDQRQNAQNVGAIGDVAA